MADVAAIEANLPTGPSALHARRFGRTADGAVYLLAWLDDAAVGHVLVTAQSKYEEVRDRLGAFPEVNALGVATAYRRRGVARALMEAAAGTAVSMGGTRLGLAVEPDNEPAVGLYRALGFRRHPTVDPVDEWTWIDESGIKHVERDSCTYWSRGL
jgi:ribosomal protein S18 acetylase RimI-like enzyme